MNWSATRIADILRRVASESEAHQVALAEMIARVSEIAGRDPLRIYPVTLCFDVGAYPRADEADLTAGESKSQPLLPTVRF